MILPVLILSANIAFLWWVRWSCRAEVTKTQERIDVLMLTGHHENCPMNRGVLAASKNLIEKLVRGIEDLASQETDTHER